MDGCKSRWSFFGLFFLLFYFFTFFFFTYDRDHGIISHPDGPFTAFIAPGQILDISLFLSIGLPLLPGRALSPSIGLIPLLNYLLYYPMDSYLASA